MAGRLIVVADTWGHQQARANEEQTVLTKSRWRLTKASGGAGGLGDRIVEDDGDTCRDCGGGVADTHFSTLQEIWAYVTIKL